MIKKYVYDEDKFEIMVDGAKHVLSIHQDADAEDPRNWDNLTVMLCWHRRYNLGDKHSYTHIGDALQAICDDNGYDITQLFREIPGESGVARDRRIIDTIKDKVCVKYLYLYDHSGITISTSDFGDPWDSGIVGIVYVTKDTILKELCNSNEDNWYALASSCIENEVDTYDQYLRGDIYSYTFSKINKCECCGHEVEDVLDSMSGFFGNDILSNGMLEYLPNEVTKYFEEEVNNA